LEWLAPIYIVRDVQASVGIFDLGESTTEKVRLEPVELKVSKNLGFGKDAVLHGGNDRS
jgi:hypothetical protein